MTVSSAELLWALDDIEATAWRDIVAAAPPSVIAATGLTSARAGGVTLVMAPRLPSPLFNRALGLGNGAPATDGLLDEVIVRFTAAGVGDPWIHVSASARPGAIAQWLGARGCAPARRRAWVKVVRGREPAPPIETAFALRELDRASATPLARVLCEAHGLPDALAPLIEALIGRPGWRAYGAFDGEALIAGGLFHSENRHAWLGFGGTLAPYRGRGAQGALMARRIADAIAQGAQTISAETGEPIGDEQNPSLGNMMRCGFRIAGARSNWCLARP